MHRLFCKGNRKQTARSATSRASIPCRHGQGSQSQHPTWEMASIQSELATRAEITNQAKQKRQCHCLDLTAFILLRCLKHSG